MKVDFTTGIRTCFRLSSYLLATLCLAGTVQASGNLTPHVAEYNVKVSVVSGTLRTELKATGTGYIAEHTIKATGMSRLIARGEITEVSDFGNGPDGLYPLAYRSNDTLSRDKTRADIQFDWGTNQAMGTVNGQAFEATLEGLSHDRVSIQYELMHDLLSDGPSAQYRMFDIDKQRLLNIRTIGKETVKVPAGSFEAIGIQHQAENSSRVTTLWCVRELGYLPVMIEQHRKGKLRVRAKLRSYSPAQ